MPGKFYRALVHIGAKRHRCSACRVNFVSFFPRKTEYVNPAKVKRMATLGDSGQITVEASAEHEPFSECHQHAGM